MSNKNMFIGCLISRGKFCPKCSRGAQKKCPLYRGFSVRVWPWFGWFLKKASAITRCPLYNMFAIGRFDCIFVFRRQKETWKILLIYLIWRIFASSTAKSKEISHSIGGFLVITWKKMVFQRNMDSNKCHDFLFDFR